MTDRPTTKEARRNSVKDAIEKITGEHPAEEYSLRPAGEGKTEKGVSE